MSCHIECTQQLICLRGLADGVLKQSVCILHRTRNAYSSFVSARLLYLITTLPSGLDLAYDVRTTMFQNVPARSTVSGTFQYQAYEVGKQYQTNMPHSHHCKSLPSDQRAFFYCQWAVLGLTTLTGSGISLKWTCQMVSRAVVCDKTSLLSSNGEGHFSA